MPPDPTRAPGSTPRTWIALFAALVTTGFVVALPFLPSSEPRDAGYALELNLACNYDAIVQVFWDQGAGIDPVNSVSVPAQKSDTPAPLRFALPAGRYRQLRFDPINHPGAASFSAARIVDADGRIMRSLPVSAFVPANDIATLRLADGQAQFRADRGDPYFTVDLTGLDLPARADRPWVGQAAIFVVAIGTVIGIALLFGALVFSPSTGWRPWAQRRLLWLVARPAASVALVAFLAALLSCYPLVFLGKSLVSPNFGPLWLYTTQPTLPGSTSTRLAPTHGSDVGALFWFSLPFTAVERRALAAGELPLWNRFNDSGNPLLAQGQSMFGDPLQFITIFSDSAAWAWDLRFILARFLLAFGVGLCVWGITGKRAPALLLALSAPFIGFFFFRINHPAAFGLCYAPWILFAWILVAGRPVARSLAPPLALWLLANWSVLNSGTVKEAYFLGLGLNAAGALLFFFTTMPVSERRRRSGLMLAAGLGFIMIAAPVWLNFLACLRQSATAYDEGYALQIPPGLLPGFFDDIFYRPATPQELAMNPSVNFFVFIGVLWCLATLRETLANPAGRALCIVGLLSGLLVFGVVPPDWIKAVPFLGHVGHINNTFSCVLVVVALVLAGLGWSRAIDWLAGRRRPAEIGLVLLLAALLAANYLGSGQAQFDLTKPRLLPAFSPFFHGYVASLLLGCAGLLGGARLALRRRWWSPAAWVVVACCWVVLHWRMGLQAPLRDDAFVICPPDRADFHAPSPSMTWLQARVAGETPARVAGLQLNLVSGVSGFYGLEGISGSDPLTNGNYQDLSQAAGLSRKNEWAWQFGPEDWRRNHAFYDLLNVRYLLTREEVPPDIAGLEEIHEGDLNIFRSATAWPRAFFTDQVAPYGLLPEFVDLVRRGDGRPFAAVPRSELANWDALAVEKITAKRSVVAAGEYHLGMNYTEFVVRNDRPGIAVLMETDREGDFTATCDGQRVPHFRVDHAFKAVRLGAPGPHRIRFTYRPRFWSLSLGLAAGGAGLLGATFWKLRRRQYSAARS